MRYQVATLFLLISLSFGCNSARLASDEPTDVQIFHQPPIPGQLDFSDPAKRADLENGPWEMIDGAKVCRGYLTERESEDYCAKSVPDAWKAFTYDDQTYYFQPLSGS
jgi:hypothetical protein